MMNRISILKKAAFLALLMGAVIGCAPTRYVRPLEKGEKAISGTLGGHIFTNFGAPIPIPFTTIGFGYGAKENLTAFGNFHPTAASFGVIQVDGGVSHAFFRPQNSRPGLTISPVANLGMDVWEGNFRFWPQLDMNAWWEYGSERQHYFYGGFSLWAELVNEKAHGEVQKQHVFPGFQLGNVVSGKKWDFTFEVKYSNPMQSSVDVTTVRYLSPGGRGAIGTYVGLIKRF